jgi:hypothetical protein
MFRKSVVVAMLAVLVANSAVGVSSSQAADNSQPKPQPNSNQISVSPFNHPEGFTVASVDEPDSTTGGGAERREYADGKRSVTECASFAVAPCDSANRAETESSSTYGNAGVTACTSENDSFCLESIKLGSQNSAKRLKPIQEIAVVRGRFEGDPKKGVPGSGSIATVWQDPENGDLYASSASLLFTFDKLGNMKSLSATYPFRMTIRKIAIKNEAKLANAAFEFSPCVFTFGDTCYVELMHNEGLPIEAQVRLPFKLSGWFYGRLMNTAISATKKSTHELYLFSGKPVQVPTFAKNIPKSQCIEGWCPDRLQVDAMLGVNWLKAFGTGYKADKTVGLWKYMEPKSNVSPWQAFVQMSKDTASDIRTAWSVSFSDSLTSITYGTNCKDATGGINGVLTSNAMIYSSYGPTLEAGFFNYRVAGLHYKPDGITPTTGTYELQIDSKLARCIFKLSNLPISATLSVLTSDGRTTTVVGASSESKGMLRITMQGFNFSMPILRAKIHQGAAKSTILCVSKKNKSISKFVTGSKPTCSTGYVKKTAS